MLFNLLKASTLKVRGLVEPIMGVRRNYLRASVCGGRVRGQLSNHGDSMTDAVAVRRRPGTLHGPGSLLQRRHDPGP